MARINKRQWKPLGTHRTSEEMQAIADRNAAESRLLSLPPDIRNRIYRLVLGDSTIHIWSVTPERRCRTTTCLGENCNTLMINNAAPYTYITEKGERLADYCANQKWTHLSAQFLRTCRQVSMDAALIPYATNDFRVHSTFLTRFEKQMSVFQKKSIKTLTMLYGGRTWRYPVNKKAVQKFSGLEKLNVVAYHNRWGPSDMTFLESFGGLPLRDISILELQEIIGKMQSFDHQALCKRLVAAREKEKVLEPIRKAKSKERAAMIKQYHKRVSEAFDEEVRQIVQSGSARAVRAEQRQKHRGDET